MRAINVETVPADAQRHNLSLDVTYGASQRAIVGWYISYCGMCQPLIDEKDVVIRLSWCYLRAARGLA